MLFFCQPKKKLQRNKDTELQTQFFFREKKSYKETKIRSYKLPFLGQTLKKVTKKQKYRVSDPFFFRKKATELQSYKATKLQTLFFCKTEKSYKETKIQSYRPQFNFWRKKKKLQRNEDTKLQSYKTAISSI